MKAPKDWLAFPAAGIATLAVSHLFGISPGGAPVRALQLALFGPLVPLTLAAAAAVVVIEFRAILRAYGRVSGFPWLSSVSFAAAAVTAIVALHWLLPR